MSDIQKFKKEAKEKGMILIGDSPLPKHYLYKFKKCGHEREMKPTTLRNSEPKCKICTLERFAKEAFEKGLILIPEISKPKHYLYQFIECGHTKEYEPRSIRRRTPTCDICMKERFSKEAESKGLKFIGDSDRRGYYLYQFNQCGHIKESRPDMINSGYPCCEECGDTYHAKESSIYLIKIFHKGKEFLKLGVANNIPQRVKTYKLKKGFQTELISKIDFKTNFDAVRIEKAIHKKFSSFNLPSIETKKIMRSGFTECYPISLIKELKKEVEKII